MKLHTILLGCAIVLLAGAPGAAATLDPGVQVRADVVPCITPDVCVSVCVGEEGLCISVNQCGPTDVYAHGYPTCIIINIEGKVNYAFTIRI